MLLFGKIDLFEADGVRFGISGQVIGHFILGASNVAVVEIQVMQLDRKLTQSLFELTV